MIPIISSFLIILSFSIGGVLGFLAGNGTLFVKLDLSSWISALATVLGALATIYGLSIAKKGLNSWKKQYELNIEEKLLVSINQLLIDTYNLMSMLNNTESNDDHHIDFFIFNNLIMSVAKLKAAYRVYQTIAKYIDEKVFNKLDELEKTLIDIRNSLLTKKLKDSIKTKVKDSRKTIQDIEQLIINITNKNSVQDLADKL